MSASQKGEFTIRTRKWMTNPLLNRKQMIVDVYHGTRPNVPKAELATKLATIYKVKDPKTIFLFGFRTKFGGGKSSGFCLVYDDLASAQRFEPKFRLVRAGLGTREQVTRKSKKEKKNRAKKVRGTKKKVKKEKASKK